METLENSEKIYDVFPKSTAEHSEKNKVEIPRKKKRILLKLLEINGAFLENVLGHS